MSCRRRRPFAWARRLTALGFLVSLALAGRAGIHWLDGAPGATHFFRSIRFADPLAALEVALASRELHLPLLRAALLVALFAVLLGPVFCGWLCPLGLFLDLNQSLRRFVLTALLRRPAAPPRRLPAGGRYLALGAALGLAFALGVPLFQSVSPVNALVWTAAFAAGPALLVVAAVAAVEWLLPRFFCRALCPTGALYALLGRLAPFKVRIDQARAGLTPCRRCTAHCPMGIPVMEVHVLERRAAVDDPECIRCGACVDGCPGGVLRLGLAGRSSGGDVQGVTAGKKHAEQRAV